MKTLADAQSGSKLLLLLWQNCSGATCVCKKKISRTKLWSWGEQGNIPWYISQIKFVCPQVEMQFLGKPSFSTQKTYIFPSTLFPHLLVFLFWGQPPPASVHSPKSSHPRLSCTSWVEWRSLSLPQALRRSGVQISPYPELHSHKQRKQPRGITPVVVPSWSPTHPWGYISQKKVTCNEAMKHLFPNIRPQTFVQGVCSISETPSEGMGFDEVGRSCFWW